MSGKQIYLILNIIENSFIEILFVNKKQNSNKLGGSIKSKKAYLNDKKNITFPNSKIQFNSINSNDDIFDVYLLYNNKKVISLNSNINYYRISVKDLGITNEFSELNFEIVNNVKLKINIRIKNNFDASQKISVKDRLKFFNLKVEDSKKSEEIFHQKYKKWDDTKKGIETKKKLDNDKDKKIDTTKNAQTPKKAEQPKTVEQPKQAQPKSIENSKNIEANKESRTT